MAKGDDDMRADQWERLKRNMSDDVKRLNADVVGGGKPPAGRYTDAVKPSPLEEKFLEEWSKRYDIPLEREYRFAPPRRWRFDFAHVMAHVAVELEGGIFSGGRHTRGYGYQADAEKYNHAAAMGWMVFRLTTGQVTPENLELIHGAIQRRKDGIPAEEGSDARRGADGEGHA